MQKKAIKVLLLKASIWWSYQWLNLDLEMEVFTSDYSSFLNANILLIVFEMKKLLKRYIL